MKKKRAIALRKLCGFNPHHPRTYHALPTGATYDYTKYDKDGKIVVEKKQKFQMIAGQKRASYKQTKKMYLRGELK